MSISQAGVWTGKSYTYRDPLLSLWQSAAAEVRARRVPGLFFASPDTRLPSPTPMHTGEDDLMLPVHVVGEGLSSGGRSTIAAVALDSVVGDCARIAAEFLWAKVTNNKDQSAILSGELKYAECDAGGWSECLTTYLAYKAQLQQPVYRAHQNVVIDLGAKTRIAIIGDWGTGDAVAINVLQEVAKQEPDILVHLGDIYYAGTESEARANFFDVCRSVLGSGVPLLSLCGNHDMYSGGTGYYSLLDRIQQHASYFCLQNADWMFLAMDTGFNDRNPMTVTTNMTALVDRDGWSEAAWHLSKIAGAAGRKIVLLSHHPLFSPFASVGLMDGESYAWNPNLFSVFQSVLPRIAAWFWGHEHTLALYEPYLGLRRGRCVGASAIPVFKDQQKYAPAAGLKTLDGQPLPAWDANGVLGNNGTDYDHCFAILTLNGSAATAEYYTVPILQPSSRLNVSDSL